VEVKAIKALPIKAVDVTYIDRHGEEHRDGGQGSGLLVLKVQKYDRDRAREFLRKYYSRKDAGSRPLEVTAQVWYKKRTLAMNNLMWGLLAIMSYEVYQKFGHEEELYQDMLDLYAPKFISKFSGKARNKTSSKMNTLEMGVLIDGIFRELAQLGIEFTDAGDIDRYWLEFYEWRGKQKEDPLAGQYESVKDYKEKVVFCEACRKFLQPNEGQVAHIVSTGAGGIDYGFNLFRLCTECHINAQHQQGWDKLVDKFPHIKWKIDKARELQNKKPLETAKGET
jgi:hypothetical protein